MSPSGGHWIMNIVTGAKMHKPRVWEVPITESIIHAVESLAELQGYKEHVSGRTQAHNLMLLQPLFLMIVCIYECYDRSYLGFQTMLIDAE